MLRNWCSQNKGLTPEKTHVLMDGGILSIPFDKLDEFYKVYVQSIRQREYIYVVEQKTFPYYNFFVDIDYTSDDALELHQIEDISRYICKTVRQFSDSECLVSVAKPKSKGDLVKTGIHLNWGTFVIDQTNSINMRDHIICELSSVYPSQNWNSIIDKSVYGNPLKSTHGSGFRMPWSHKKGKHDQCNGQGCSMCVQGKIIEGEYLPCFVYNKNSVLTALESQEPTVELLHLSSIRYDNTIKCTIVSVPEVFCKPVREGGFTQKQLKNEVFIDEDTRCQLETFIRQFMKGQKNAKIIKMLKNEDSYFVQTDSKFCENIGREHNSNHIWFYISRDKTIRQKCFCTCLVNRRNGSSMCKDFSGQEHNLKITRVVNFLFPEKKLLITSNNETSCLRIDDYFNRISDTVDPCIQYISSRLQY